ncbi:hypothetical protein BC833DRAFT_598389 [Globomyces pollinis-pini]|nr:hypothetical protein BC833DRAFT_598389 [Globomyces pollinis-pini]
MFQFRVSLIRIHSIKSRFFNTETGSSKRFTSDRYGLEVFTKHYPLVIKGNRPRESSYNDKTEDLQWYDKMLLVPIRTYLAEMTTRNWINLRFKEEDADADATPYMPDEFMKGAKVALTEFFKVLPNDVNQTYGNSLTLKLSDITTKRLFEEFHQHHLEFQRLGLELHIKVHSLTDFEKDQTWLLFGPKERVTTTLTQAQIHTSIAPMVMWRVQNPDKNPRWLFKEMSFEYDFPKDKVVINDDGEAEPPTFSDRSEVTREGAILGIDVKANIHATISVVDKENPDSVWTSTIQRPINFRLETSHMKKRYTGSWKIADIDNLFASEAYE